MRSSPMIQSPSFARTISLPGFSTLFKLRLFSLLDSIASRYLRTANLRIVEDYLAMLEPSMERWRKGTMEDEQRRILILIILDLSRWKHAYSKLETPNTGRVAVQTIGNSQGMSSRLGGQRVAASDLSRIQEDSSRVRNVCILAHVDHGKTTWDITNATQLPLTQQGAYGNSLESRDFVHQVALARSINHLGVQMLSFYHSITSLSVDWL